MVKKIIFVSSFLFNILIFIFVIKVMFLIRATPSLDNISVYFVDPKVGIKKQLMLIKISGWDPLYKTCSGISLKITLTPSNDQCSISLRCLSGLDLMHELYWFPSEIFKKILSSSDTWNFEHIFNPSPRECNIVDKIQESTTIKIKATSTVIHPVALVKLFKYPPTVYNEWLNAPSLLEGFFTK